MQKKIGPGEDFADYGAYTWTFGVEKKSVEEALSGLTIKNGMIIKFDSNEPSSVIAALNNYNDMASILELETNNYLLTVTLSIKNSGSATPAKPVVAQELKDLFGRTVSTLSSPLLGSEGSTGIKAVTRFVNDPLGKVLLQIPPKEKVFDSDSNALIPNIKVRYNTVGQVLWKEMPDGCEQEYSYRDDGQVGTVEWFVVFGTRKTVRKLIHIYDERARLSEIREVANGEEREVAYYYYDKRSELDKQDVFEVISSFYREKLNNLRGRAVAKVAVNYVNGKVIKVGEAYTYDDEGRVIGKFRAMTGTPLFQENWYTFDLQGHLILDAFYYAEENIAKRYNYDHLDRLVSVEHGVPESNSGYLFTPLSTISYDDMGKIEQKRYAAISTPFSTELKYDVLDRITDLTSGTAGNVIFKESIWSFDAAGSSTITGSGYALGGNISNVRYNYGTSEITQFDCSYLYDDLNRLSGATLEKRVNGELATIDPCDYTYDILGRFRSKREGESNLTGYTYYSGTSVGGENVHGTSRLRNTSKNTSGGKHYLYDLIGNMVVDFTKNMVVEYDWRDMPIVYRFYSNLERAGLSGDIRGNHTVENLSGYLASKVADGTVSVKATVTMVYNTDGNRVCKMEVRE